MSFKLSVLIMFLLNSSLTWATILPPNDLHLQDNLFTEESNITEEMFNQIITQAEDIYAPIIASHGATLKFNRLWENSTVNASASQANGTWIVNMYGGFARRPEVTPDGFALVVCHELGHHLGGYPFYQRGSGNWAANEGQSDYFATQSCAHKLWSGEEDKNRLSRETVDPAAKEGCDSAWSTEKAQNLCYRTAMGGHSLATLLGSLRNTTVDFATPSEAEVLKTSDSHPQAQCRLDTYFHGALCSVDFDSNIIPGRRHSDGQRSEAAEGVAVENSCAREVFFPAGNRPLCWYKPLRSVQMNLTDAIWEQISGNGDDALQPGETFGVKSSLVNGTGRSFEDAKVQLETGNDSVIIEKGTVQFPDSLPGTTVEQEEPFVIKIRENAACGQFIDLDLSMIISGAVAHKQSTRKRLGQVVGSVPYKEVTSVSIPDNNSTGISQLISVAGSTGVVSVKFKANITHPYSGDLIVRLISPAGREMFLREKQGGSEDNVILDEELAIDAGDIQGDWTLKIRDAGPRDIGTLDSWSLEFTKVSCE